MGALVRLDNHIYGMGYNGAPKGMRQCKEAGCLISSTGHCMRSVHAEANAILNCRERPWEGFIARVQLWSTHQPCIDCTKLAISVGITEIIFLEFKEYPDLLEYYKNIKEDSPIRIYHLFGGVYDIVL